MLPPPPATELDLSAARTPAFQPLYVNIALTAPEGSIADAVAGGSLRDRGTHRGPPGLGRRPFHAHPPDGYLAWAATAEDAPPFAAWLGNA
jgi:hypothetical protein